MGSKKALLICILILLLTGFLTSCQESLELLPEAELRQVTHWSYHWGDLTPESTRQSPDTSPDWHPIHTPLNPPERQGRKILWLRTRLPDLKSNDCFYLRGIDEVFEVYLNGKKIYHFGHFPSPDQDRALYPGFPWHMIPLHPQDSQNYLYFRIYSDYRHIGIFGMPRIASPAVHLDMMLLQDTDYLLVGSLLIFTGLLVLLLFLHQAIQGYWLLSLFAISIGTFIIARTELKQLFWDAPMTWKWLEMISLYMSVPCLCLFLNQYFGQRLRKVWNVAIAGQSLFAALSISLAAIGLFPLQDSTQIFLTLTLLNMLMGLIVVCLNFRHRGTAGWISLLGILLMCGFTGYDILASLKLVPWIHPVSHWGLLLLMMSLIFLVKQEVETLYQEKRVAEEANRTKSAFLSNLSHELRTPLNAILGFSRLLQKNLQHQPQERSYAEIIHRSGNHLLSLLNDLLDLSRIDSAAFKLKPEPIQIRNLLQEIQQEFNPEMQRKGLSWGLKMDPELPQVLTVDAKRLTQILHHLVDNALKFTDAGQVELRVKVLTKAPHSLTLSLSVQDTGIGISNTEQNKVFQPFYQVGERPQSGGTGLGLHLVQQLLGQMSGHLNLKSQPGQGTEIEIQLPDIPYQNHLPTENPPEPEALTPVALASPQEQLSSELQAALQVKLAELHRDRSLSRLRHFADWLSQTGSEQERMELTQLGTELQGALLNLNIEALNTILENLERKVQKHP